MIQHFAIYYKILYLLIVNIISTGFAIGKAPAILRYHHYLLKATTHQVATAIILIMVVNTIITENVLELTIIRGMYYINGYN